MPTIANARRVPRQDRSLRTVDHILEATRSLLARMPYHQVTTKRIAREPGLSVGALYAFFPDRASIIDKIARRHIIAVRSRVEKEVVDPALRERPPDAVALIRRAFEVYVAYLDEHADFRAIEFGRDAKETRNIQDGSAVNGITAVLCAFCYNGLSFDFSPEGQRKLRVGCEAGLALMSYAYRQPTHEQREKVIAEAKKMLAEYLGRELRTGRDFSDSN